jgi:hypothetical protein
LKLVAIETSLAVPGAARIFVGGIVEWSRAFCQIAKSSLVRSRLPREGPPGQHLVSGIAGVLRLGNGGEFAA